MLSHQTSVQQVFVGDGWEGSHTRVGSHKRVEALEERAQVIMTNCNERFEDTTTKLATGVASNLAGMAANAYSGGDPLSWSNVLNKLSRGALGGIKSLEALDYFNEKMGVAIDENAATVPNPRVMYTSRISKTCEGQSIESLVSTLEQSNILKDQSLNFERCAEIQTLEQLPECKEGMASICKQLNATVNDDYKKGKEAFKGNLVSLLTGNMMVMVQTQVIEPLAFAAAEVTLDVVKDINKRMEKEEQEEKLRREQEESKVREKLFTYNQDIFTAHENNANQEEATSDSQEQKRGKKGDEKIEVIEVKERDTVSKLAKDRGQSVEDVVKANPWLQERGRVERDGDGNIKHVLIKPGEKLVIPVSNANPSFSNTNKEDKKDEFNLRGKDAKEFLEFLKSYNKDPKAPDKNGQDASNNKGANCPGDGPDICGFGNGQGNKKEVYRPQRDEGISIKKEEQALLRSLAEASDLAYGEGIDKKKGELNNKYQEMLKTKYKNLINQGYKVSNCIDAPSGLFIVALKKDLGNGQSDIILSVRGTEPFSLPINEFDKDFTNDMQIAFKQIPIQYHEAEAFTQKILSEMKPGDRINLTGHSLGGALAQMLSVKFGISAITFDSPGVKGQIEKLVGNNYDPNKIKIYNSLPNFINSWGEHIKEPTIIMTGNSNWEVCLNNICYAKNTLFSDSAPNSHRLQNIINNIELDGSINNEVKINNWPKSGLGFYGTIEAYNLMPEVYDKYIQKEWNTEYNRKAQAPDGFVFDNINFQKTYPTYESYKEYYLKNKLRH